MNGGVNPGHHCDYCNNRAVPTKGPFLDCTVGFNVAHMPPQMNNVPADTSCSMCFDDFEMGQPLLRHEACQHIWHQSCIDAWVDMSVQNAGGETNVTCGMCRAPIMHVRFRPGRNDIVTLIHGKLHADLAEFVDFHGTVRHHPREDLAQVIQDEALRDPFFAQFLRDQIGVDTANGPYPEYLLTLGPRDHRPGSEIFNRVESVQGGAVSVSWCPHIREYFFMAPETYYTNICALFAAGWAPHEGVLTYFRPRLRAVPRRLPDLLGLTQEFMLQNLNYYGRWRDGEKAVELFPVQLQQYFPHSKVLSGTTRLYLRIIRPSTLPNRNAVGSESISSSGSSGGSGSGVNSYSGSSSSHSNHDVGFDWPGTAGIHPNAWHRDWQVLAIAWSEEDDGSAYLYSNRATRDVVNSLGGIGDSFTLIIDQDAMFENDWLDGLVLSFHQLVCGFEDFPLIGFLNDDHVPDSPEGQFWQPGQG